MRHGNDETNRMTKDSELTRDVYFDQATTEKIKYYVYALFDPDQPRIPFYIGKGKENRVFSHARAELNEVDGETLPLKLETIKAIKDRGRRARHVIVQYGLSEPEALLVESALIDMVNHVLPDTLTNIISGHGSAENFIDADDLARDFSAMPIQCAADCLLLIKIERRWAELLGRYESISLIPASEIYAATRGSWKINVKRASQAKYVLAVARGLVRGVYKINNWKDDPNSPGRKKFDGDDISDTQEGQAFINGSVATFFTRGAQSPIRYICCDPGFNESVA